MNPSEYIAAARRTCNHDFPAIAGRAALPDTIQLMHAAIGLATESGEVLDAMKKHLFYGKPIDRTNLVEEAGDVLWYLALMLDTMGVSFEQAMAVNIAKLQKRFPEKFTEGAALNRNLEIERATLEKGAAGGNATEAEQLAKAGVVCPVMGEVAP